MPVHAASLLAGSVVEELSAQLNLFSRDDRGLEPHRHAVLFRFQRSLGCRPTRTRRSFSHRSCWGFDLSPCRLRWHLNTTRKFVGDRRIKPRRPGVPAAAPLRLANSSTIRGKLAGRDLPRRRSAVRLTLQELHRLQFSPGYRPAVFRSRATVDLDGVDDRPVHHRVLQAFRVLQASSSRDFKRLRHSSRYALKSFASRAAINC